MPRLPTVVDSMGARPIPQNGVRVVGYTAGQEGQALAGVGRQLGKDADELYAKNQRDDLAEAQKAITELGNYTNDALFNPDTGALNRKGVDAFNLPEIVSRGFDQRASELRSRLSPTAQRAFDLDVATRRQEVLKPVNQHTSSQRNTYNTEQHSAMVDMSANSAALGFNNPDIVSFHRNAARDAVQAEALANGWSPEKTASKLATVNSTIDASVITRQAETGDILGAYTRYQEAVTSGSLTDATMLKNMDNYFQTAYPAAKAEQLVNGVAGMSGNTGAANFDSAVRLVMQTEGGFVGDDAGAGPTNMGINSRANPDVDVKNLTPSQARDIYRTRYWNAIGADNLPPATALVAFDAAVNQGPGVARKLIEQSGGDPARMISMRRLQYAAIAEDNPEKAQYLDGWNERLDKLQQQIDGSSGSGSGLIDLDAVTRAVSGQPQSVQRAAIKLAREQNTLLNQQIKQQQNELEAQAVAHIDNGGTLTNMPVSILSGMTLESRNRIRTFAEAGSDTKTDPVVWGELQQRAVNGSLRTTDLIGYRNQLSISDYKGLIDVINDPAKQLFGRVVDDTLKRYAPIIRGSNAGLFSSADKRDAATAQAQDQFRRAFEINLEDAMKNNGGQIPSQKDIISIADQLMANVTLVTPGGGWFGGETTETSARYMASSGQRIDVAGIDRMAINTSTNRRNEALFTNKADELRNAFYTSGITLPDNAVFSLQTSPNVMTYDSMIATLSSDLSDIGEVPTAERVLQHYNDLIEAGILQVRIP